MNYIEIKLYYDSENNLFTYGNKNVCPNIYKQSNNAYQLKIVTPNYDALLGSMYVNFQKADGTVNQEPYPMVYSGTELVELQDNTEENWHVYSAIIPDDVLTVSSPTHQNTLLIAPEYRYDEEGSNQIFTYQPFTAFCRYSLSNQPVELDDDTFERIIEYVNTVLGLKIDKFDGLMRLSEYFVTYADDGEPIFDNLVQGNLYIVDETYDDDTYHFMQIYKATSSTTLELFNGGVTISDELEMSNVPQDTLVYLTSDFTSGNVTYDKNCLYVNENTFEDAPSWVKVTYSKANVDSIENYLISELIAKTEGLMRISEYTFANNSFSDLREGCLYIIDEQLASSEFQFGDIIIADNTQLSGARLFYRPLEIVSALPTSATQGKLVYLSTDNCVYKNTSAYNETASWSKVAYSKSNVDSLLSPITTSLDTLINTTIPALDNKVDTLKSDLQDGTVVVKKAKDFDTSGTIKSSLDQLASDKLNKDFSGLTLRNEIAPTDILVINSGGNTYKIQANLVKEFKDDHYKGIFNSLSALQEITGIAGDYAYVEDTTDPNNTILVMYIWDADDNEWQVTGASLYVTNAIFSAFQSGLITNGTIKAKVAETADKADTIAYGDGYDTIGNIISDNVTTTVAEDETKLITSGGVFEALSEFKTSIEVSDIANIPTETIEALEGGTIVVEKTAYGESTYVVNYKNSEDCFLTYTNAQAVRMVYYALNELSNEWEYSDTITTTIEGKQDTLVSGSNIKTINNVSVLGSGNLDVKELFICTYGTTTTSQVTTAISNGKLPIFTYSGDVYVLANNNSSVYTFTNVKGTLVNEITLNTDVWSAVTTYSLQPSALVTDFTNADNAHYPSAKLVNDTLATKQGTLSSTQLNAVNSGIDSTKVGQITTNATNISTIQGVIPSAATTSNQLADKNFVNSSIATNTAKFIGTFVDVESLNAYDDTPITNNDYANVTNSQHDFADTTEMNGYEKYLLTNYDYGWVVNGAKYDLYRFDIQTQTWSQRATNISKGDVALITAYNRYTYTGATSEWVWNYTVNTSGFTSEQWAAINSGITSTLVGKITTNENNISSLQSDKLDKTAYATTSAYGLIKLGSSAQAGTMESASSTSGRYYPVQVNANGQASVNVPWTDTVYTPDFDTNANVVDLVDDIFVSYTITTSVTNGTYSGSTTIDKLGTATVTIIPDSGYDLPTRVTVTGNVTSSYNYTTGVITLSGATENITISAECESSAWGGTNLTGTTWVFNDNLINNLDLQPREWSSLQFISNNQTFGGGLDWDDPYMDYDNIYQYELTYWGENHIVAYKYVNNNWVWNDNAYKTIQITGGTDATNSTLIQWLQDNATLISW